MLTVKNVKFTKVFPSDIPNLFTFLNPSTAIIVEGKITNFIVSAPDNPVANSKLNNIFNFDSSVDCKTMTMLKSEINMMNVFSFKKANGFFRHKRTLIENSKFNGGGFYNYLLVNNGNVIVSDSTLKNLDIKSSRMIQVVTECTSVLVEKLTLNMLKFSLSLAGMADVVLPRMFLSLSLIGELTFSNIHFNKVYSKYSDKTTVDCLFHTDGPVLSLIIFDIIIPDNFEVCSYFSHYKKVTDLRVESVRSIFSKGYFDGFAGGAISDSVERRNNFISVFKGVTNAIFSNILIKMNVVQKSSFILIYNAEDLVEFSDITAEDNLVSNDIDLKSSLATIIQTDTVLKRAEMLNSHFTRNYFYTAKKTNCSAASGFSFQGQILYTLVQNVIFLENRAPDFVFDNFDIMSKKTSLMEVTIISNIEKEITPKISNISGNGASFSIFGFIITVDKTKIMCHVKSPNLKFKIKGYVLEKDAEVTSFKVVEDYYRFRC